MFAFKPKNVVHAWQIGCLPHMIAVSSHFYRMVSIWPAKLEHEIAIFQRLSSVDVVCGTPVGYTLRIERSDSKNHRNTAYIVVPELAKGPSNHVSVRYKYIAEMVTSIHSVIHHCTDVFDSIAVKI